jgi:hypothetical protein
MINTKKLVGEYHLTEFFFGLSLILGFFLNGLFLVASFMFYCNLLVIVQMLRRNNVVLIPIHLHFFPKKIKNKIIERM